MWMVGPSRSFSEDELVPAHLPHPPDLHGKQGRSRWNANHFAYLGDAVWEVRARFSILRREYSRRDVLGAWRCALIWREPCNLMVADAPL